MNRIQLGKQQFELGLPVVGKVQQSLLTSDDTAATPYSLFVPLHYEKKYAYPLLLWLHGPEDNESQLKRIMPLVSMRNYVAIGPRGTFAAREGSCRPGGFAWRQTPEHITAAQQSVFDCIELAQQRTNVAPRRIFLGGYACGGTMAFRVAMSHPEQFAGVFSIGGAFPAGHTPLQNVQRARSLPLLVSHGRDSHSYAQDRVCDDLRLLHSAGMSVTLRQYPCGDELTTKMLSDVDTWIMEQVTGVSSTTDSVPSDPSDVN